MVTLLGEEWGEKCFQSGKHVCTRKCRPTKKLWDSLMQYNNDSSMLLRCQEGFPWKRNDTPHFGEFGIWNPIRQSFQEQMAEVTSPELWYVAGGGRLSVRACNTDKKRSSYMHAYRYKGQKGEKVKRAKTGDRAQDTLNMLMHNSVMACIRFQGRTPVTSNYFSMPQSTNPFTARKRCNCAPIYLNAACAVNLIPPQRKVSLFGLSTTFLLCFSILTGCFEKFLPGVYYFPFS